MLLLLTLIYFRQFVRGDCPDGWTRRGDTKWCYKAFEKSGDQGVTWNQAQGTCVKYGADLVSYESKSEMEWVYNIMNWNQNSGSWRYYWNGLNDLQTRGKLEWVSTHPGQGSADKKDFLAVKKYFRVILPSRMKIKKLIILSIILGSMQICMILRDVALFRYFRIIYHWIMVMKENGTKKNVKRQKVCSTKNPFKKRRPQDSALG